MKIGNHLVEERTTFKCQLETVMKL